jgi:sporulation protein YlmC with PRC-barrel domain
MAKTLKGYKLNGADGEIGRVREFCFDAPHWTIRYLLADTGTWLAERQILISPYALLSIFKEEQQINISLTKWRIENSPSLHRDKPVSRQFEQAYHEYYDWPAYWDGPHQWGSYPYIVPDRNKWKIPCQEERAQDHHVRGAQTVRDYHVHATDGEIGRVEDFVIDCETWAIRYVLVNTHNFLPGRKVLVSPQWIKRVSWGASKIFINLSREACCLLSQSTGFFRDQNTQRSYYCPRLRDGTTAIIYSQGLVAQ